MLATTLCLFIGHASSFFAAIPLTVENCWGLAVHESSLYVQTRPVESNGSAERTIFSFKMVSSNQPSHSVTFPHQCACLQARNCQMESKYLMVLRKLQEAMPGFPSSHAELVRNLIQEALQWDVKEGAEEGFNLNPVR